jgi:DNA-binding NarL/FixJ family response regulator
MGQIADEKRIRIALVDRQTLFRTSLGLYLAAQPDLEVVAQCANPADALAALKETPLHVVLLNLDGKTVSIGGLVAEAQRAGYGGHFLIVTEAKEARELAQAINLGASGVFPRSEAPDRLVQAIRLVAAGVMWFDPKSIRLMADALAREPLPGARTSASQLTDRQDRVLQGIVAGLTNRKIGQDIGLSESGVKGVVRQLFVRAGVRTRGQLVRLVMQGTLGSGRTPAGYRMTPAPAALPDPAVFSDSECPSTSPASSESTSG